MTERDCLVDCVVDAAVLLSDPHSQVSVPVWRRTERLSRRVLSCLAPETSPSPESAALSAALDALRRAPLDHTARERLAEAADNLLARRPAVRSDLRPHAEEFRRRNRILPVLGSAFSSEVEAFPLEERLLAANRVEPLGLDGRWELTVVVDFRAIAGERERRRNTIAALLSLRDQTLDRRHYRIVVVEEDAVPRQREVVAALADAYVHAPYQGPYNRSWAHNVGAVATGRRERLVGFLDSDVLLDRDFLELALERMRQTRTRALLPHRTLFYLDQESTAAALAQRLLMPGGVADRSTFRGYRLLSVRGGCLFVDSALFHEMCGFDERYEGWGDEDNEFFERLEKLTAVDRLDADLLHLHHPRPPMERDGRRANEWLLGTPRTLPVPFGDPDRYRDGAPRPEQREDARAQ